MARRPTNGNRQPIDEIKLTEESLMQAKVVFLPFVERLKNIDPMPGAFLRRVVEHQTEMLAMALTKLDALFEEAEAPPAPPRQRRSPRGAIPRDEAFDNPHHGHDEDQ